MNVLLAIYWRDLRLAIDLFLREEPGINVIGVANETESLLALLKTTHPHVVLLSWDLPGRTIPEVLSTIHTAPAPPRIIVLGNNESEKDTALAAGADAFLVKGKPPQHLAATIREMNLPKNQVQGEEEQP